MIVREKHGHPARDPLYLIGKEEWGALRLALKFSLPTIPHHRRQDDDRATG